MTTGLDRLRRTAAPRAIGLCATLLIAASPATAADDASRWDGDARSAIRLIAGSSPAGKTAPLRAGIEIRLKPGWHTYWRYPGDAGVPPRFDFAGSQNVKAVEVLWPAPQRIPEESLVAIGYTGDVTLPLAIVPQNAAKPVVLRLKLDYAVCEKLCVPAEGKGELVLAGGPSSQDAALAAAAARVPQKVALGQGSTLAIKSVRREDGAGRPRIVVDVAAPPGTSVASCSPRGRRRIGRCRCPRRSKARRPACNASRSSSTVRRPGRSTRAPPSPSRRSRGMPRSRSRPISTNSPGAVICFRCAVRPGRP